MNVSLEKRNKIVNYVTFKNKYMKTTKENVMNAIAQVTNGHDLYSKNEVIALLQSLTEDTNDCNFNFDIVRDNMLSEIECELQNHLMTTDINDYAEVEDAEFTIYSGNTIELDSCNIVLNNSSGFIESIFESIENIVVEQFNNLNNK